MKEEDLIDRLFVAYTHDTLLCFSNRGRVYWLRVFQLPLAGRGGRGKPIVNLIPLEDGERITAMLPIRDYPEDRFVFMATSQGTVKKTPLEAFSRPRAAGIIAVTLEEGDRLVGVDITDGSNEIMLATTAGKAIRFPEDDVRPMGREAAGVRGVALGEEGHEVNALIVLREGMILTASENGYGKLTEPAEFPLHGRGGQGVIALQLSERNGRMVGALQLLPSDDVMLISQDGTLVRTAISQVSVLGRNTQGVRLMRLDEGDRLVGLARVQQFAGGDEDAAGEAAAPGAAADAAGGTTPEPAPDVN